MVPPPRPPQTDNAVNIITAYSLDLLSEYTHTLDALPIDLSRNFADLRELDAVLSSSMASITAKIVKLTQMIEDGTAQEERLWLLTEISEEAQRLKPGGEDKIRVACQAADHLKSHTNHLRTLLEHLPNFDASRLNRQTTYPHVATKSYMPAGFLEPGRRRRGGVSSVLVSVTEPSPAKRKRSARDDDADPVRSPKKVGEGASRQRNVVRNKRQERGASPTESIVSFTSHRQGPSRGQASNRAGTGNSKRKTGGAAARGLSPDVYGGAYDPSAFNVPPSTSHPSLPVPYQNFDGHPSLSGSTIPPNSDWNAPRQLEGPGMPIARNYTPTNGSVAGVAATDAATEVGDGELDADGEGDDNKRYCFCNGVSYGEMIACDDDGCEREWFHLSCIGLEVPPEGTWFCDTCRSKRNSKRTARGGKRKGGGGRSGARG